MLCLWLCSFCRTKHLLSGFLVCVADFFSVWSILGMLKLLRILQSCLNLYHWPFCLAESFNKIQHIIIFSVCSVVINVIIEVFNLSWWSFFAGSSPDKPKQQGEATKPEHHGTTVPLLLKGKERRPISQLKAGVNTHKSTQQHRLNSSSLASMGSAKSRCLALCLTYCMIPPLLPVFLLAWFSSAESPVLSSVYPVVVSLLGHSLSFVLHMVSCLLSMRLPSNFQPFNKSAVHKPDTVRTIQQCERVL